MYLAEAIQEKWAPVLDHEVLGTIKDQNRRSVTAIVLENTEKALRESAAHGQYQTLMETGIAPSAINAMGGSSSTAGTDRKSTRLNSSHVSESRMPSSA